MSDTEKHLPDQALLILPVRRMVLFPGMTVPIAVGRAKSITAVQLSIQWASPIAVVMQKDADCADPEISDLHRTGTKARILRHIIAPDGTHHLIVQGEERIQLREALQGLPCLAAFYEKLETQAQKGREIDAGFLQLKTKALEALALLPETPEEVAQTIAAIHDPGQLSDMVAQYLDLEPEEKQEILESTNLGSRVNRMLELLAYRIGVLELSKDISQRTQQTLSAQQRQHILRQQLAAIRRELGETNGSAQELTELKEKIETLPASEEVRSAAMKEYARLERIPESSTEYAMVRSYLETLIDLPWAEPAEPEIDLERAQQILDEDHYGLGKIKKRIVEFLAVSKLKGGSRAPILCFVGPPGVGKTSLGQSIARAMGRKFARLSLGGVHDESEIRGHRMTYVGAMPGNIIKVIQRTGTRDCVLMLDEIDKLGASRHGDPSSALLEVLDPAQNSGFRDNYLNLPFDLSRVVFIATANVLESIQVPLRDRMEVIMLSGYTLEEKTEIAERYLVARQCDQNGLKRSQCTFRPGVIRFIIEHHTREAGVRNLERELGAVIRAGAVLIAGGARRKISFDRRFAEEVLGPPKFDPEIALASEIPGVSTGMAWTPVGGDILFIEATPFPGSGKLILTGQLGEVMKESAQAALSLVKGRATLLGIEADTFSLNDIHIHVPAGAIQKDGPSAGVAIVLALVSALKSRCVRSDTAVTGEISLRGLVLPVGGIKEKVIAADRAGIRRVLIPGRNHHDIPEIPENVRSRLEIILINTIDDALKAAFDRD